MSTQNKNYFTTNVPAEDRFLSGDEPTQGVFGDLFDSIPFKLEAADTATEATQGLTESATQVEFDTSVDFSGSSFALFVRPSFIKTALTTLQTLLQVQIDAINATLITIQGDIVSIQNNIITIQGDITTIQAEIIAISASIPKAIPIGTIILYPVAAAPSTDYLECNGQSLFSASYPDLFAIIGTNFGGGAGSFNLPDFKQKLIAGYDPADPDYATIGTDPAPITNFPTLTGQQSGIQTHSHPLGIAGSISTAGLTANASPDSEHKHQISSKKGSGTGNPRTPDTSPNAGQDGEWSWTGYPVQTLDGIHTHTISGSATLGGDTQVVADAPGNDPLDVRNEYAAMPYFIKVL